MKYCGDKAIHKFVNQLSAWLKAYHEIQREGKMKQQQNKDLRLTNKSPGPLVILQRHELKTFIILSNKFCAQQADKVG